MEMRRHPHANRDLGEGVVGNTRQAATCIMDVQDEYVDGGSLEVTMHH